MVTLSVLSQKGGVGKTTLSTNLAAVAHLSGLRTLVVDCDRQGSAYSWFHARSDGSKLDGLSCVKSDKALTVPKLRDLARGYEMVILDGPPRLSEITTAAAIASDVCIIPVRAGAFDYWATGATIDLLDAADSLREQLGMAPTKRVFVLNGILAGAGGAFGSEIRDALKDVCTLASTTIHQRIGFARVGLQGESVATTYAGSAAASEIEALYQEVTA